MADASIAIPIVAEDQTQQTFDNVTAGFRNLSQEGQALTSALQQQSESAKLLQTSLSDLSASATSLRDSAQTLQTGISDLTGVMGTLSSTTAAQVESINLLKTSYAELAAQMAATKDAAASMGNLGTSGSVAGSAAAPTIMDSTPLIDRGTIASMSAYKASTSANTLSALDIANNYNPPTADEVAAGVRAPVEPTVAPESGTAGESGGGGYGMGQMLGYMAAYQAMSMVSGSIGRSGQYSRDLGTTQAMTGLSNAAIGSIGSSVTGLAGSGMYPYTRDQLLAGDYSVASLGIGGGDPTKVAGVGNIVAQTAAAGGAPDTTSTGQALTTSIAAYGQTNAPNVVQFTQQQADQLIEAVKIGKAEFADMATQITAPMQQGAALGLKSSDIYAYLAAESSGGVASGQIGQDLYSLEASTLKPTQIQQAAAAAGGFKLNADTISQAGGLSGFSNMLMQSSAGMSTQDREQWLTALFGNEAAAKGFTAVTNNPGYQSYFSDVANSGGAEQTAFNTSQSTTGAKLADASIKLQTSFDELTTTALPALTIAVGAAAKILADVPDIIDNWGKVTPSNPAGGNQAQTLAYLIGNFATGGGVDITKARNMAATGGYETADQYQLATDPQAFLKANADLLKQGPNAFFTQYPDLAGPLGYQKTAITQEGVMARGNPVTEAEYNSGQYDSSLPTLGAGQYYTEGPNGNLIVKSFTPGGLGYRYTTNVAGQQSGSAPNVNIALQDQSADRTNTSGAPSIIGGVSVGTGLGAGLGDLMPGSSTANPDLSAAGRTYDGAPAPGGADSTHLTSLNQFVANLSTGGGRGVANLDLKRAEDEVKMLLTQTPIDQNAVDAAMSQVASTLAGMPGDPIVKNNTLISFQQTVDRIIAADALKSTRATLTDLESQYKVDMAAGNLGAADQVGQQIAAYYISNASALGLSGVTAQADALKYTTGASAAAGKLALTPDQVLIHPQDTGPGSALAGYESSTARLSQGGAAGNPLSEMVRHLQSLLDNANKELANDQQKIRLLQALVDQGDSAGSTATPMTRNRSTGTKRAQTIGR